MKRINNIIMLCLMLVLTLFSVNAVSLEFDQAKTLTSYTLDNKGYAISEVLVGSKNDQNIFLTNSTLVGDIIFKLKNVQTDTYLIVDNNQQNTSLNIHWFNDDNTGLLNQSNFVSTQSLNLNDVGLFYFKVTPTYEGENIVVMVDANTGFIGDISIQESVPKGLSFVFETFISGLNDIITIIVSLWKLFYYVLIMGLILGLLMGMIGFVFKFIEFADRIKEKKKELIRGGK